MKPIEERIEQGLRGQIAGRTAISTLCPDSGTLTYRGYEISELAALTNFEEVVLLLLRGELPTDAELATFRQGLANLGNVPLGLRTVLEGIPKSAHPMDVLRTACSTLGALTPEPRLNPESLAHQLFAVLPSALIYWYRFSHDGIRIDLRSGSGSIAAAFLERLHDKPPTALQARALNASWVLYAEHEFSPSTFAARICASTQSDLHSCVAAAIGTLRGTLHGGANEAAMDLIDSFGSAAEAADRIQDMLDRGQRVMGFGHAIYQTEDPRNRIIKQWASDLAVDREQQELYRTFCAIEQRIAQHRGLLANAEFFHAAAYRFLGVPTRLFTALFACARLAGWVAHVFEQRQDNRVIRPRAEYVGVARRPVTPLAERSAADPDSVLDPGTPPTPAAR